MRLRRFLPVLAWATALVLLAAVFLLYTRPSVLVALADQVWACVN